MGLRRDVDADRRPGMRLANLRPTVRRTVRRRWCDDGRPSPSAVDHGRPARRYDRRGATNPRTGGDGPAATVGDGHDPRSGGRDLSDTHSPTIYAAASRTRPRRRQRPGVTVARCVGRIVTNVSGLGHAAGDGDLEAFDAHHAIIIAWCRDGGRAARTAFSDSWPAPRGPDAGARVAWAIWTATAIWTPSSPSRNDNKIAWYENDGFGQFGPQQVITTSAFGASSVHAGDLDGDGDLDAFVANPVGARTGSG